MEKATRKREEGILKKARGRRKKAPKRKAKRAKAKKKRKEIRKKDISEEEAQSIRMIQFTILLLEPVTLLDSNWTVYY